MLREVAVNHSYELRVLQLLWLLVILCTFSSQNGSSDWQE